MGFYDDLRVRFRVLLEEHGLSGDEGVQVVSARSLGPREVIGNPDRDDFPLLRGKEVMVEASFRGSRGQAYTDEPGEAVLSLEEILDMPAETSFQRAVLISSLNAVMRYLGMARGTVHCRDEEPKRCASELVEFLRRGFSPGLKVAFFGYQPAMISALAAAFGLRVVDLDPENVGQVRCGVLVEGPEATEEVLGWGDLVLATGSTFVNGTFGRLMVGKRTIFYGVSVAGIAELCGLERFCPFGR